MSMCALSMHDPVVLYARKSSIYKTLGLQCYDEDRDARCYLGSSPVIAHPPCRSWGKLKGFAKPLPHERELAIHALWCVRLLGGVLEHPAHSSLWSHCDLPRPGEFPDLFGGFTIQVDQGAFGHRAVKSTWLYMVGIHSLPAIPPTPKPQTYVERMCRAERERTPLPFAQFLLYLARQPAMPR